ncbi:aurora kinase A activator-like protein bora [Calliopsis andreniformis]|uniref:aurora kinase A activator-like protein bora n=1 Tax=Calliopsis andreniformis TaxID=337506 RepID=UPI003FCEC241
MDQLKWTTPIKNRTKCELMKSPIIYRTPVKQNETVSRHTTFQNNMSCFSVLPNHITPPSGLTKFIARNPFESDLTNRLHLSVISPTVFSKTSSPSQCSPDFTWSIDDLALLQPAKIEEFPTQQLHCMDPETEIKAQAAIDKFFKENQIIPSPWELKRKENRIIIETNTATGNSSNLNLETSKSKKDGWSQTVLSFPPELPQHVAEILKPYLTFTQEQNVESDDANSSNNSLRRKLFFNHEDCVENEEETSICLSPVKMEGSLILPSSPPQSGMLVHGAPLKHMPNAGDTHNTSHVAPGNLSPPNISPIHSTVNNMSCESMKSRSRSVARLNFTAEMSIDESNGQHKNGTEDESFNKDNEQIAENKIEHSMDVHNNSTCIQIDNLTEAKIVSASSSNFEYNLETETSEFNSKQQNDVHTFKHLTESCKIYTNENCRLQQTNGILGVSDQQSVSNFAQDTGYQTYSMSSTTNVTDSYNSTPVKQKACWSDRILLTDDEFRLCDWKENIKNIFSSTPSRSNRERDNHIH